MRVCLPRAAVAKIPIQTVSFISCFITYLTFSKEFRGSSARTDTDLPCGFGLKMAETRRRSVTNSGLVKTHIPLNPLTTPTYTYICIRSGMLNVYAHAHLLTHAEYLQHTARECIPSMAIIDRLSFTTGIATIRS